MTIQDMHYDFKLKFNKIDTQQNRNLIIPEIDWFLNEGQEMFVKTVAEPRERTFLGFETTQRTIDDIKSVVVEETELTVTNNIVTLPDNYWYYVSSYCQMKKNNCIVKSKKTRIQQHDDDFENSPFDKSSFEWRTVNGVFNNRGIRLFTEDFEVTKFYLSYIHTLKYIHNAANYANGSYTLPSGIILSGTQDCELPDSVHREVVDFAVLAATIAVQSPDYESKAAKLKFNLK